MKKKIRWILFALILLILGYYIVVLSIAAYKTADLKAHYLSAENMPLQWSGLSPRQQEILIKVQDPNFFNHHGVEFSTPGSGWTTITQSIVKWLYFENFKQGIRKIKQTLIAYFIVDSRFSKEEQLTIFMNNVWFEKDVVGFAAAAQFYYQKPMKQLTEDEYISLVAMIVAPKQYHVRTQSENNALRVARIKKYLAGDYRPIGLFDIYYDQEAVE